MEYYSVIKSENDDKEYRSFVIPNNGLKVLLKSDPSTEKGAASLSVAVGILP